MNKIVTKGIKIDLHIHSVYSNHKDAKKVANNTLGNLPILVNGLISNDVNMCAITDHDNFNYNIYSELKKEEQKDNCIYKVLPGIEFSVEFAENTIIHIVTIFSDKNDNKVKNIENIMINGKGNTLYKKTKQAYTKDDFLSILADIDLDFVMIVHQKNSPLSERGARANDAMSLGKDVFHELVYTDYFDAYEFRNKRNEIYNKIFIEQHDYEEKLRFLTGSDCHRWEFYPYTEKNERTEFVYTYIKSLPTFKGLAMAVTDYHRIELENSFFNPNEKYIPEIIVDIDGESQIIPLSRGLNVIIGDNSIGKSLFLNMITGDYKAVGRNLKTGYEKYLNKNKITFKTVLKEEDIFMFNTQGEIRETFDNEEGIKPNKYLKQFYPNEINAEMYRAYVDKELQLLYDAIESKFSYDNEILKLPNFNIPVNEFNDKGITFIENTNKINTNRLKSLINSLDIIVKEIKEIMKSEVMLDKDKENIKSTLEMFVIMKDRYNQDLDYIKIQNVKINVFNTYIKNYKMKYNKRITDEQSIYSNYIEYKQYAIDGIAELLDKKSSLVKYEANITTEEIAPETNPVDEYKFVSKISVEKIDNDYIYNLIKSILKKDNVINTEKITQNELKSMIKKYPNEDDIAPLEVLKNKVASKVDEDFKIINTIIKDDMDVFDEVSSGFDAQMYFTLISGETRNKGIYIVDQPEDHISQRAIKKNVIKEFRRMGENRQVIMVTHNPQFIVNLDVDNVIFLSKDNGKFKIQSGALEYEDDDYNILKIVAENIDGGLQTIQGRMKRYEKDISV